MIVVMNMNEIIKQNIGLRPLLFFFRLANSHTVGLLLQS
jgi:hypothetical protein